MNSVSFYGSETAGSPADRTIGTAKQETTGSVAARIYQQEPEIKLQTLDRDTVSFRANEENKSSAAPVIGTIAGIGALAAAIVVGLGCAKKYNWVDKISNEKVKNVVTKYGTDPCYKACQSVKKFSVDSYNKIAGFFKGKKD
ncbi:hypothetical protein IKQ21_06490 [bacterium]|nr:hypothetical protein [bacterium]